jgi:hypothetical protein
MDTLVISPREVNFYPDIHTAAAVPASSIVYVKNEIVEYYSSSHKKWYETTIVQINADNTLDLACRRNVDQGLVRRKKISSTSCQISLRDKENVSVIPNPSTKSADSRYEIGMRVEYYSDSLNGWVLSYVKGYNPDGTYQLNTKKSANASKIRSLITCKDMSKGTLQKLSRIEKSTTPIEPQQPIRTSARIGSHQSTTSTIHRLRGTDYVVSIPLRRSSSSLDLLEYKAEILSQLNLTFDHAMTRMRGFTGGQNEGIFFIQTPQSIGGETPKILYCLKTVRGGRKFDTVPCERENYISIKSRYPSIVEDDDVAFPKRVFEFSDKSNSWDVFVMKVARGERMAEVIGRLVKSGQWNELAKVYHQVGSSLQKFHHRYNSTQHCDLQCSNIYIHGIGESLTVTLIDLGGMGSNVQGNDVEYFSESIRLLARTYGSEFERIAIKNFSSGYSAVSISTV